MHPFFWFKGRHHEHAHHEHAHHEHAGHCGPGDFREGGRGGGGGGGGFGPGMHAQAWGDHDGGGAFGVRRPLRFLANRLELDDEQVASLARILDELKTERAQAAVDDRRTTAAFADAIAEATFDDAKARTGAEARVKSAERLRDAVVGALTKMHAVLKPEQRERFAYLVRTGALQI